MKKELAFELCIYAVSVVLAGFFWHNPAILMISYVAISMIMLTKWHERSDLIFYCFWSWPDRGIICNLLGSLVIFKTLLPNPHLVTFLMGYYCFVSKEDI